MDVVTTKEEVLGRIWDSIMLVKLLNIDSVFVFFFFLVGEFGRKCEGCLMHLMSF